MANKPLKKASGDAHDPDPDTLDIRGSIKFVDGARNPSAELNDVSSGTVDAGDVIDDDLSDTKPVGIPVN